MEEKEVESETHKEEGNEKEVEEKEDVDMEADHPR